MAEIYGLTKSERDFLQRLKTDFEGQRYNPAQTRIGFDVYDEGNQAPETYVALVPSGGIPAATNSADGATLDFSQGDKPGQADCEIYKVVNGGLESIEQNKPVHNLTATAISQSWITATRDKFGNWFAVTGGGGSSCDPRNEIWQIFIIGDPLGGSFDLTFSIDATSDTVSIDYDDTSAEAETAILTHSQLSSGDVDVTGGALPHANLTIEFKGDQANTPILPPTINMSGLSTTAGTGTTGDVSGLGVILTRYQPGYAG